MPASPHEPEADERAKRVNRGCWIALVAGLALTTIAAVVVMVIMNRIIDDSPVPAWGRRVGEGADIILDAQSAPGTGPMRERGCEAAMIVDLERALDFLETLEDAGTVARAANAPTHAAVCWTRGAAPTCADLAAIVVQHGRLRGDVGIAVLEGDRKESTTTCAERYDASGKHLGPFDASTVPMH